MSGAQIHRIDERRKAGERRLAIIQCRTYGHAWDEQAPPEFSGRAATWGFRMSLRCSRCTTWRHDVIDSHGDLSVRTYDYVEGYRDEFIDERPTRAEFRLLLADAYGERPSPKRGRR